MTAHTMYGFTCHATPCHHMSQVTHVSCDTHYKPRWEMCVRAGSYVRYDACCLSIWCLLARSAGARAYVLHLPIGLFSSQGDVDQCAWVRSVHTPQLLPSLLYVGTPLTSNWV